MLNFINNIKREKYRSDSSYTDQEVSLSFNDLLHKVSGKRITEKKAPKGNNSVTIQQLLNEFNVKEFSSALDLTKKITNVATHPMKLKKGGIFFLLNYNLDEYESHITRAIQQEAAAIFTDKDMLAQSGTSVTSDLVIPVENGIELFKKHYNNYRKNYDGTVIAITGSVGKTSTKGYIDAVLAEKFNTFVSPVSQNAFQQISDNIFNKMTPEHEIYVQEIGAMRIGSIALSAEILEPDITVLTNVKEHHLATYKTFENVFADKLTLADKVQADGYVVANFDDENLASYQYNTKVISFGIETNHDVDYKATNIIQNGDVLTMDIVYDGKSVNVTSNILGEYNAYNILAAFAIGKLKGLDDETICRGISKYSSSGIRQNIMKYGNNTLLVDCFNVSNETIINAVKVIEGIPAEEGARKIAIIGGENTLGEFRIEKTRELGQSLATAKIDKFVCFGTNKNTEAALDRYGDAETLYSTLKESGFEDVELITSFDELTDYMESEIKPNDIVLLKCIIYLNMPIAIDKVFGTNIALKHKPVLKKSKTKEIKGYTGLIYAYMNEVYLTKVSKKVLNAKAVKLPSKFSKKNIFGVNKGLFAYCNMKTIDFGSTVKQIGVGAFKECHKVTSLEFPDSTLHIMDSAFKNCHSLTTVKFGKGIRQIDSNAFAGCNNLKTVILPKKEGLQIENGAFPENVNFVYFD